MGQIFDRPEDTATTRARSRQQTASESGVFVRSPKITRLGACCFQWHLLNTIYTHGSRDHGSGHGYTWPTYVYDYLTLRAVRSLHLYVSSGGFIVGTQRRRRNAAEIELSGHVESLAS